MNLDIARYVEIVGKDNIERNLKKKLKIELRKAIDEENWELVKEIIELIETVATKQNSITEKIIRYIETFGGNKFKSDVKNTLDKLVGLEEWVLVKKITKNIKINQEFTEDNYKLN